MENSLNFEFSPTSVFSENDTVNSLSSVSEYSLDDESSFFEGGASKVDHMWKWIAIISIITSLGLGGVVAWLLMSRRKEKKN